MKAEISFDIVMDGDLDFVEGTYRLPGHDWQVLIFSRNQPGEKLEINTKAQWESGVTGIAVHFPRAETLTKVIVLRILSDALGVDEWDEVCGPDSMRLR